MPTQVNQKRVWDDYENTHMAAVRVGGPAAGADVIDMMSIPNEVLAVEGTVTSEYTKSRRVREAEFIRFRERFLQDVDCPVQIPSDFSFSTYLTMMSAKVWNRCVSYTHTHSLSLSLSVCVCVCVCVCV